MAASAGAVGGWVAACGRFARQRMALRRRVTAATEAACRDRLTGLGNRAYLEDRWPALSTQPCVVMLADADGLKPLNDTAGHAAGDELLSWIGLRLTDYTFTGRGLAVRLGGDEFVVVLPAGDPLRAGRQVHDHVCGPHRTASGRVLDVRVSVGVAVVAAGTDLSSALQAADAAMYRAKRSGAGVAVGHVDAASTAPRAGVRSRDLAHARPIASVGQRVRLSRGEAS